MRTLLLLCLLSYLPSALSNTLLSSADFLQQQKFTQASLETLWLSATQQQAVAEILSHPYAGVRIRYWQNGERLAFILNEIGKELPITFGVVVDGTAISQIEVLVFRESRGDEISSQGFRNQFSGLILDERGELNKNIDGISGATYSVRSMKKIAKLALYLQQQIKQS